jgi:ornithine cyclodeaminase/alanine dehydrogenase-like protein (mu-crystallin family)
MQQFVFLDEQATAALLTMKDVVETCEAVLRDQGCGEAHLSDPAAMFLMGDPEQPTRFKVKGGYLPGLGSCGFRIVGDIGEDGQFGEQHYCLLLDPSTGKARALVAQTELHRMRTAACALVALRHLVSPTTRTVTILGAGRIAAKFAAGFHDIFPDWTLIIASRRIESATALADHVRTASRQVEVASIPDAVVSADAIVALTSATEPVIAADVLRPGMTIIGMGEHHELPVGLLRQADRFIVDDFGFASVLGSLASWLAHGDVTSEEAAARRRDARRDRSSPGGRTPVRRRPHRRHHPGARDRRSRHRRNVQAPNCRAGSQLIKFASDSPTADRARRPCPLGSWLACKATHARNETA